MLDSSYEGKSYRWGKAAERLLTSFLRLGVRLSVCEHAQPITTHEAVANMTFKDVQLWSHTQGLLSLLRHELGLVM